MGHTAAEGHPRPGADQGVGPGPEPAAAGRAGLEEAPGRRSATDGRGDGARRPAGERVASLPRPQGVRLGDVDGRPADEVPRLDGPWSAGPRKTPLLTTSPGLLEPPSPFTGVPPLSPEDRPLERSLGPSRRGTVLWKERVKRTRLRLGFPGRTPIPCPVRFEYR